MAQNTTTRPALVAWIQATVQADPDIRFGELTDLLTDRLDTAGLYFKRLDRQAALDSRAADVVLDWLADQGISDLDIISHQGSVQALLNSI